ncbi:haloacid dehalogenase-like hydrolase [Curtobacterium pusillum]|uniref:haloacid dehalogenase-like hydrolase n=1 Tax=Curtobacterium pusillum TaxID=69373 RepID=UPI0015FE41F1
MPRPLTVFDLDGVITSRDTMADLCGGLLRRRPSRLFLAVGLLVRRRFANSEQAVQRCDAALVALALRGMTLDDYESAAERTVRRFVSEPDLLRPSLIEALQRSVVGGPVVVATASEVTLARRLLEELGVGDVEVIGSELAVTPRGLRFRRHNVGERKLASLLDRRLPLGEATFYTDSTSDLPVATACGHTVYVGGDQRAFTHFVKASWWAGD